METTVKSELKTLIESQVNRAKKTDRLTEALEKLRIESKAEIDRLEQLLTDKPIAVKVRGKIWEAFCPSNATQRAVDGRVVVRPITVLS